MKRLLFRKKSLKQVLFISMLLLFTISITSMTTFAQSRLYFDEDGSLIFIARSGKDHSGIKFRTIGWVLKRYDLPMNASGQQYVIIPKRTDGDSNPDPVNPEILICRFKSDSDEILKAIGKVSQEWKSQLLKYGGDIYIDSVMTVVIYGTEMGKVGDNGELLGEIYCTYEGIANAKPWGNKEQLKQYYDLVVEYPCKTQSTDQIIEVTKKEQVYKSPSLCSLRLGSNKKNEEIFDVGAAIPSGEKLYLDGKISNYIYEMRMNYVKGNIKIPIKVTTTYLLKWKGINGENKEERRTVSRVYTFTVPISYYELVSANVYAANGIVLENNAIKAWQKSVSAKASVSKTVYGEAKNHISVNVKRYTIHSGTKTISSNSISKPSIPEESYESLAKSQLERVNVKSDKVSINNNYILNDAVCRQNGKAPIYFVPPASNVYIENIVLNREARNNTYGTKAQIKYKNVSNNTYITNNQSINSVSVFTPVVCSSSVSTEKSYNQEVAPVENTIVLGCNFKIDTGSKGFHSDNKGYGNGDYSKYVKNRQMKFPFVVEKDGIRYSENEWIDVGENEMLYLPYEVNLGDYQVEIRNYAINSVKWDSIGGEGANKKDEYFAYSIIQVHVAGKLFDYTVDGEYKVKDLLCEEVLADDITYTMKAAGNYTENDYVKVNYLYHYYKEGERIPAEIYIIEDRNSMGGMIRKADISQEIPINTGKVIEKNLCEVEGKILLGKEIYIFPKGTKIEGVQDIVKNYKDSLTDGMLVIGVDSYIYRNENPYISYINEENSRKGYCNMWKEEGFVYNQIIGNENVRLHSGDSICCFSGKKSYLGYTVVGTH